MREEDPLNFTISPAATKVRTARTEVRVPPLFDEGTSALGSYWEVTCHDPSRPACSLEVIFPPVRERDSVEGRCNLCTGTCICACRSVGCSEEDWRGVVFGRLFHWRFLLLLWKPVSGRNTQIVDGSRKFLDLNFPVPRRLHLRIAAKLL